MNRLFTLVVRSFPREVAGILSLTVLLTVFEGVGMGLLLPILEGLQSPSNVVPSHPMSRFFVGALTGLGFPPTVLVLFSVGASFFLLQAIFKFMQTSLAAKTSAKVELKLRRDVYAALLDAQLGYFHQKRLGDLSNAVVKEAERASGAFNFLTRFLAAVGLVVAYLVIASVISWKLTAIVSTLAGALLYLTRNRRAVRFKGEEISRANEALLNLTVENLIGIRDVKIFGLESQISQGFNAAAADVSHRNWLMRRLLALRVCLYETAALAIVFLMVVTALLVVQVQAAVVVAFMAMLFRLRGSVIKLQSDWDGIISLLPGLSAVDEIRMEALKSHEDLPNGTHRHDSLRSSIEFQNVSHAYYGEQAPVLKDVSLRFEQGTTTAIVGMSGAGKSTLVDLIVRFYDPTEGQVLVDGISLKDLDIATWRWSIGFVSQDVFLFNDTVFNNIRFGNLKATKEEVEEAARLAYAHEFICELPDGYETVVGDRGAKLSGGERQRIALARAALRNPQILILDEATSGLDSKSERFIQESLKELSRDRTAIIIAHRLSTVRHADKIVVLEKGRVVEVGDHETLLSNGKHYSEFCKLQFA